MLTIGRCKLCLQEHKDILESHFISRKLYYSGKKKLEFVTPMRSAYDAEELTAPLLCRDCEHRFSIYGENEVLRHVKPKYVLKNLPLAERMAVAYARDNDVSAPRFYAGDFNIDSDKFAYFALSIIWRRAVHEWHPGLPKWELGQFTEQMRRHLMQETPFPENMAVIVIVCKDTLSRRLWTIPYDFVEAGCLNFAFDARGIRFRLMMGHLPPWAYEASCLSALRPIFLGDCAKRSLELMQNTRNMQGMARRAD